MASRDALAALVAAEIATSGRSQVDLCATVGITPKHLSQFVNGRAGMSHDLVDALLAELGRVLVVSTMPRTEAPDAQSG